MECVLTIDFYGHENMYAKDYTNPDGVGEDDRIGMTREKNQMHLQRLINTGLQEVNELWKYCYKNFFFRNNTISVKE